MPNERSSNLNVTGIEQCTKLLMNSGHYILVPNVDKLSTSFTSMAYVVIGDGWSDLVHHGRIFTANISSIYELQELDEFRRLGSRVLFKLETAAKLNAERERTVRR